MRITITTCSSFKDSPPGILVSVSGMGARTNRDLPEELWLCVLSSLDLQSICGAASTCKLFSSLQHVASTESCSRLWPSEPDRVRHVAQLGWKEAAKVIRQYQKEKAAVPNMARAADLQKVVLQKHRSIAVEWMIEVIFFLYTI